MSDHGVSAEKRSETRIAMTDFCTTVEAPIGRLSLIGSDAGLRRVCFPGQLAPADAGRSRFALPEALRQAAAQLEQYFAGERRVFELKLALSGTAFQQRVWAALQRIPYGATTTYGELARSLGEEAGRDPFGPRAVGSAVGRTPTPIIVPCHRVLGADGSLTGYGGGLERKQALLELERAYSGVVYAPLMPPSTVNVAALT
jgi:methylated-DNA-[protein]-cysteine S-methyltransferase